MCRCFGIKWDLGCDGWDRFNTQIDSGNMMRLSSVTQVLLAFGGCLSRVEMSVQVLDPVYRSKVSHSRG